MSTLLDESHISSVVEELQLMLPLATPDSLRQYVLDANGDYQTALQKAIGRSGSASASSDTSSIYSYFPSDSPAPMQSNGTLSDEELRVLRAKYAKQANAARLVLGDAVEEQTILQTFEAHGGDAKKAMSELLGRSSGELRRSLQFSDALRLSSSGSLAAPNNGALSIDNFRKSMNLDVLGVTEETEFDFSAITPIMSKREERNEDATSETLKSSKEKEREVKRQLALAKKKEREASKAKSDDQRAAESLDAVMTATKREEAEARKAELNLAPWPVNLLPSVDPSLTTFIPEEPVKKVVPKILDKTQLGAEEKHDADALHAFLRRRNDPTVAVAAASQAVKRISLDEFIVVSRQVRKLRLLHTSRHRAILDAGITGKPQDTLAALTARKAKERVTEEATLTSTPDLSASSLTTPIDAAAIMKSMDLSAVLNEQREAGLISSLDQTIELCQQAQLDELAQLEAILTSERCHVAECTPRAVSFSLSEPSYINPYDPSGELMIFQNPLMLQLIVILPPTYPELSPPLICVRSSSPHCPIGNFEPLERHLREEAASLLPIPSLFTIQQSAETWLLENEEMKQIAQSIFVQKAAPLPGPNDIRQSVQLQHQTSPGTSSGHLSAPALYEGLRALFNESVSEFDFQFHRFEDLLFHRNKQLEKAASFIIKCYDAIGSEHPVIVEKRKLHPRLEFPVLNLTGDLDYTASLGVIYLNHAKLRQLLDACDWNLQKMSGEFLDSLSSVESYVTFLTSHGLTVSTESISSSGSSSDTSSLETETECPICFCDFARHQGFSLSCGHYACIDCYCEYANVHVSSGSAATLTCTACKIPFDPLSLCALLTTKRWATFCNSVVSQYVSRTDVLKWCPSSKPCDFILQTGHLSGGDEVDSSISINKSPTATNATSPLSSATSSSSASPAVLVQCKCNHMYCSKCKTVGGHLPMTCEEQARWVKLFPDDMKGGAVDQEAEELTKRMLAQITRACPRCGVHISKSGGCPHMSCMSCHHQFCWVCFEDWTSKHYACNQASVGGHTNAEVSTGTVVPGSASLLFKHRNAGYDIGVTVLANSIINPMYVLDDRVEAEIATERTKQGLPPTADGRVLTAPKAQERVIYGQIRKGRPIPVFGDRETALTFSDVETFINVAELLQLAHYITTNIIKFVIMLNVRDIINVGRTSQTYLAIDRVISDLLSISDHFKQSGYSKAHLWHIQSSERNLRVSLKLLLEHVQYLRDNCDIEALF